MPAPTPPPHVPCPAPTLRIRVLGAGDELLATVLVCDECLEPFAAPWIRHQRRPMPAPGRPSLDTLATSPQTPARERPG